MLQQFDGGNDDQWQLIDEGTPVWQTESVYNHLGRMVQSIGRHDPDDLGPATDYEYDEAGRQTAVTYPAVPDETTGEMVRHRAESEYDKFTRQGTRWIRGAKYYVNLTMGQLDVTRENIRVVVDADGNEISRDYDQAHETHYRYDKFGNRTQVTRAYQVPSEELPHEDSSIFYRFDNFGRQTSESQQVDALYFVGWSPDDDSFVVTGWDADADGQPDVDGDGAPVPPPPSTGSLPLNTIIPTKLYEYDDTGRLTAVVLPEVVHPDTLQLVRPRYEYGYDARGNQVSIRDNVVHVSAGLGDYDHDDDSTDDTRLTLFTFDDRGNQLTRTLPLGVPSFNPDANGAGVLDVDGHIPAAFTSDPFTEYFWYNDLGRQVYHVSFEGVVTAFVYDTDDGVDPGDTGRLVEKRYFDDLDAYASGTGNPSDITAYAYDAFGRTHEVLQQYDDDGDGTFDRVRLTTNTYDASGHVESIATPEGTIHYEYNPVTGQHTRTYTGSEDPTGNSSVVSDGIAVTDTRYTYDTLGRLDTVSVVERFDTPLDEPEVTDYVYDLLGNLDEVHQPNEVISDYQYDEQNRLDLLRHYRDTNSSGDYTDGVDAVLAEYDYDLLVDGRRSGVTEKTWIDDGDGLFESSELKTTRIDWTYDNVGRLIREVYDSYDDTVDFAADYVFDLVGNRLEKNTDNNPNEIITVADEDVTQLAAYRDGHELHPDETITYTYDANDRLLTETENEVVGGSPDPNTGQTTTYGYDATQQTSKEVVDNATSETLSRTDYEYNLQGRMSKAVIDSDGDGPANPSTSEYEYDDAGIRVSKTEGGTKTVYLVDHNNPTGYAQILIEWQDDDSDGQISPSEILRTYTLGLDVITQAEAGANPQTYHLLYDGHGSTRALLDPTGQIVPDQVYAYDAYGNNLNFNPADALTTLLYSGEQFDQQLQMQYLRARYYDASTGRFNRVDPFFGNLNDPQSLHKYLYTHGDPISGIDPTGLSGLVNLSIGMSIRSQMIAGALGGIGVNILRNMAVGQPWHRGWWQAGIGGALLFPLMLRYPLLLLGGALWALYDSLEVIGQVAADENSTLEQRVGAGLYAAAALLFLASSAKPVAGISINDVVPPEAFSPDAMHSGPGGALAWLARRGMTERVVYDVKGRPVSILGQSRSSSRTDGHARAITYWAETWATSGKYRYVLMQRSVRTAIGRTIEPGEIPDVVAVRHNGRVDVLEVRSDSQYTTDLYSKLHGILEVLPEAVRGKPYVKEPMP